MRIPNLIAMVLLGSWGYPVSLPGPKPGHPDLAGTWGLSAERSPARGGFSRRGGAGSPDGMRGEEPGLRVASPLRELLRPKARLEITQGDTIVTVKDDAGWLRYLLPNGKTMREELGQGGPALVVSKWAGDRLVTERTLSGGAVYRETYRLDGKTGRLQLEVEFTTARMPKPVKTKREYERDRGVPVTPTAPIPPALQAAS